MRVTNGSWPLEISWTVFTPMNYPYATGGAPIYLEGSCPPPGPPDPCPNASDSRLVLDMEDSYGDGWNSAALEVRSCPSAAGPQVLLGPVSLVGGNGFRSSTSTCVPSATLDRGFGVVVSRGRYPTEVLAHPPHHVRHAKGKERQG